jgi:ParB-like chromosome segregation protein Spo0J
MKTAISDILFDERIYPRTSLSTLHVIRIAQAMETGSVVPPIVIESSTNRLVDGRHRVEAHKRRGLLSIEATPKTYTSEADLFADAVRLNVGHGEHLDQFSISNAILRLQQYGYRRDQISDIVRLPPEKIEKIERGFALNTDGNPVPLKSGLSHLRGEQLTPEQQALNQHYSGPKAVFHVRQVTQLIESDAWPRTESFTAAMDSLCKLWERMSAAAK